VLNKDPGEPLGQPGKSDAVTGLTSATILRRLSGYAFNKDQRQQGLLRNEFPASANYDGEQPLGPLLSDLSIPCERPVLVVAGWANAKLKDTAEDSQRIMLDTVIAPLCRDTDAVVISGGTNVGIMAALGRSMAEFAPDTVLVGVAPHLRLLGYGAPEDDDGAAAPEPRHRIIRTPGSAWGCEGPTLVRVAERVAAGRPIVMLVVGGGAGTAREIALAARRRWPVVLLTGCEGESELTAARLGLFIPEIVEPTGDAPDASGDLSQEIVQAAGDKCFIPVSIRQSPEATMRY